MGVCALMAIVKGMFTDIIRSQLMSNVGKLTGFRLEFIKAKYFEYDSPQDENFKQLIHDIEGELRADKYLIEELTELLEETVKDTVGLQVKLIEAEAKEFVR